MGPPVADRAVGGRLAVVEPAEGELGPRGIDRKVRLFLEFVARSEVDGIAARLGARWGGGGNPDGRIFGISRIWRIVPIIPGPVSCLILAKTSSIAKDGVTVIRVGVNIAVATGQNMDGNAIEIIVCLVGLDGEAQGITIPGLPRWSCILWIRFSTTIRVPEQALHITQ